MVQTAIRPDDYVEFRDPGGAVLFSTADADGVWLSSLDEPAPEVRTMYVEVPGSDGSLDLTEAVAGRPLYADREVTVGLSIVAATHPDAVRKVAELRQAVHGKAVRLETPDSRALGGWYSGRAALGEVEYPGEAAEVVVTVTARPWVVLGEHTVTLANPGYETYADGNLGTANADKLPIGVVTVEPPAPSYEYGAIAPTATVRMATADTANVLDPSIARWSMWTLSEADWEAAGQSTGWETAWDNWAFQEDLDGLTLHFDTLGGGSEQSVRLLLSVAGRDDYRGIPRKGSADRIGVRINAGVGSSIYYIDVDDTTGKNAGGVELIQVATTANMPIATSTSSMKPSNGTVLESSLACIDAGTLPSGSYESRAAAWHAHADGYNLRGSGSSWSEQSGEDENILVYNGRPTGYALVMVEIRWAQLRDVTITPFMCPGQPDMNDETGFWDVPGFSSVSDLPLSHRVFGYQNTTDSIVSYPFSTEYVSRIEGGNTASPSVRAEPVEEAIAAWRPGKAAPYVRAWEKLSYDSVWMPLNTDVQIPPRSTVELDSGDMPSALSVHVPGAAVLDANGESYTMAADGIAPFSAIGSLELGYRFYAESGDGSVTYTEGVL